MPDPDNNPLESRDKGFLHSLNADERAALDAVCNDVNLGINIFDLAGAAEREEIKRQLAGYARPGITINEKREAVRKIETIYNKIEIPDLLI